MGENRLVHRSAMKTRGRIRQYVNLTVTSFPHTRRLLGLIWTVTIGSAHKASASDDQKRKPGRGTARSHRRKLGGNQVEHNFFSFIENSQILFISVFYFVIYFVYKSEKNKKKAPYNEKTNAKLFTRLSMSE